MKHGLLENQEKHMRMPDDVVAPFRSPRVRNMLFLLLAKWGEPMLQKGSLDVSQSIHMCQFSLGPYGAFACGSQTYSVPKRAMLSPETKFALMGYKVGGMKDGLPVSFKNKLAGNTMDTRTIGVGILALLSALK